MADKKNENKEENKSIIKDNKSVDSDKIDNEENNKIIEKKIEKIDNIKDKDDIKPKIEEKETNQEKVSLFGRFFG